MKVADLPSGELVSHLNKEGLLFQSGPFKFRIRSNVDRIAQGLALLYPDYPVVASEDFIDFTLDIFQSGGLRKFWRQQVNFVFDGQAPFEPMPMEHAFPMLEWAMNWCISSYTYHFLTLHAAVVERHGLAVVMPAPPGSGKSTLCATLVNSGWRLLSDEIALVSLVDGNIAPLCRPVSLKNESLDVIKNAFPGAVLNRITHDTSKGSVSHMKASKADIDRIQEHAVPRWVVFPKYVANSEPVLQSRSKAASMLELGRNSFNYGALGRPGFEALAGLISGSDCFDFQYSRLGDAVVAFEGLAQLARA